MSRFDEDTVGAQPRHPEGGIDEVAWLDEISRRCAGHGLRFPERILRSFHTALKTAEWSPLTVLAGVSGTGKSELPRLYSHFGGIVFDHISVQPNWDSQEAMLGFFNSIDNRFDAQPLLRFLAQTQKKRTDDYLGLRDNVALVLLDEMNLAHPELYFAEFLSTLELRRGYKGKKGPSLAVKIGAGLPEYQLPLGRNVLWAGTMNQDETTKSLSDKVVDRSIIIHFPRPTTLERRKRQETLNESNRGVPLHRLTWEEWCVREVEFGERDPAVQEVRRGHQHGARCGGTGDRAPGLAVGGVLHGQLPDGAGGPAERGRGRAPERDARRLRGSACPEDHAEAPGYRHPGHDQDGLPGPDRVVGRLPRESAERRSTWRRTSGSPTSSAMASSSGSRPTTWGTALRLQPGRVPTAD